MSLRKAINLKCKSCIFDDRSGNGTWRQQVAACTSKTCPLYPVRPMPANGIARELNALENPKKGHFAASVNGLEVVR